MCGGILLLGLLLGVTSRRWTTCSLCSRSTKASKRLFLLRPMGSTSALTRAGATGDRGSKFIGAFLFYFILFSSCRFLGPQNFPARAEAQGSPGDMTASESSEDKGSEGGGPLHEATTQSSAARTIKCAFRGWRKRGLLLLGECSAWHNRALFSESTSRNEHQWKPTKRQSAIHVYVPTPQDVLSGTLTGAGRGPSVTEQAPMSLD
ncbi:hypothetical protein VTK73DRAFT_5406 [Phialemonium thermophilum]|uniref:Uncharacterized protein n=1 Tax=Phialemonium thermophilum TaxID=223376 RepID=A0ABR3V206_9PEZI